MEAIADPPSYHRARAAVPFDEISRALVHSLKYGDRLDLTPMMGRWLCQAGSELLGEADALIPVPLHRRRLWARRFNQSAMLAATVSSQTGVPVVSGALKRIKPTPPQVGLSRQVPADRKPAVSGRRLALVRRNRRRLCPRLTARGGRQCRCAGLCQGCRAGANVHITVC